MGWMIGNNNDMQVVTDSSATPTTVVLDQYAVSGYGTNFSFMVASNDYYEMTCSGGTPIGWIELTVNSGVVTFSGDLSGSRSLSVAYHNTSGFAKYVLVDLSGVGSGTTIQVLSDSGASPTAVVWQSDGTSAGNQTVWFMVPNGHYYEVTCSGAAVAHWNEYTLPFGAVKSVDFAVAPVLRVMQVSAGSTNVGVTSNTGTLKDMFVAASVTPSQTGSLIMDAAFTNPPSTPYDVFTQSTTNTQHRSAGMFVQLGENYTVRVDAGTPTLAHWWEYTLG